MPGNTMAYEDDALNSFFLFHGADFFSVHDGGHGRRIKEKESCIRGRSIFDQVDCKFLSGLTSCPAQLTTEISLGRRRHLACDRKLPGEHRITRYERLCSSVATSNINNDKALPAHNGNDCVWHLGREIRLLRLGCFPRFDHWVGSFPGAIILPPWPGRWKPKRFLFIQQNIARSCCILG